MNKPLAICTTLLIESSPQAIPLGAACIASAIKNSRETKDKVHVKLEVMTMEDKNFEERLTESIIRQNPKYVLFSVYVWNRFLLESTARNIKEKLPDSILIAGGPEVTANPLSLENFDYRVSGEGEIAVVKLLDFLEQNSDSTNSQLPQGIYSIKTQGNNMPVLLRGEAPQLELLASPYLDGTIDLKKYGGALWELARGCPFKCSYCYESKGENKVRYFPMDRIEKELELFEKEKICQVFVLDPTYNASKKRALELLKIIEKKANGIFFYFEARAEFIDRELAKAFTKIPCALQFGLQSADPEILCHVNRSLNKKLFTKNIAILNEEGVIFGFDLIYGLPKDNLEGFKKSMDFALSLYPNNLETFRLSVLPGTSLFETAHELGLEFLSESPYNIIKSDTFSAENLAKAEQLSHACNIFYNQGRAVPWFNSIVQAFHEKPSSLIENFSKFLENIGIDSKKLDEEFKPHKDIEKLQLEFLEKEFNKRNRQNLLTAAKNIVMLNGAISRVQDEGKEETISLSYHPDDLASQYATDIQFFAKNCRKFKCNVKIFMTKNGPDWKTTQGK